MKPAYAKTLEALDAALAAEGMSDVPIDQSAITAIEYAKAKGMSRETAARRLKALVVAGRFEMCRKIVVQSTGNRYPAAAYRPKTTKR